MKKFNNKGISLIEVIAAIGVIIIGIVTVVSLLYYTINTANVASQKNQAHYLAQGAIEAARRIRDNNWLAEESGHTVEWHDDFQYAADGKYAFLNIRPEQNTDTFFYRNDIDDETCDSRPCKKIYKVGSIYKNIAGVYSSLDETQYNRYIEFYRICEYDVIQENPGACAGDQIGIQIKVFVDFNKGDRTHTYELEERIYDWKY